MNILFPVAGLGTRFSIAGYNDPKPFIKIKDKYIIEYALSSLKLKGNYYIISRPLASKYKEILYDIFYKYNITGELITIGEKTSGAAETCLHMESLVEGDEELIITNCDQYTPWKNNIVSDFLNRSKNWDAFVTTYDRDDTPSRNNDLLNKPSRYSFIETDSNNQAIRFAEKLAISCNALNGIHYWKQASYFFNSAKQLINDKSITQEKYISLTFNYMINKGCKISYYPMNEGEFYSLGSPDEVQQNLEFLK